MAKSRRYQFVQLDVFTSQRFAGNPLAVFPDGRGLTDAEMQSIAREMNLSETTFILPRDPALEKERGIRVRIFTVQEELPFAGHPTLGTAFTLRGTTDAPEITLDLNAGRVPVRFEAVPGQPVFGEMTQIDPKFGVQHDREAVVRVAGLRDGDIDPSLPVETISTGMPFTIVPLRGLEIMHRLRVDLASSAEYLEQTGGKFFYFVTRETSDPKARLHARMMFYNGEDPATGSAAGCAAAWMVAHEVAASEERVLIEQGVEMGRTSHIFVRAAFHGNRKNNREENRENDRQDNRVVNVRVGGNAVEVLRGELIL
jgi:trans-2,3-dihydro-3-hydroxyanthranilate isomerase